MSLPYLPGWWDEISKNATGLASQLPQMIQPDRVANKRLQEMVQQNPMLLEQFGNMDEGSRNMLAQSLGFKNENPIAKLPVGAQRQERESVAAYNKTMTPEQRDIQMANKAGTVSQKDILRRDTVNAQQDQKFEWEQALAPVELKLKNLDVGTKELLAGEQKRALDVITAARLKYPEVNMGKVVSDITKNRVDADTQGMLTVIMADEGLSSALKTIIDIQQTNQKYANDFGLRRAGMQDDVTRLAISAVNGAATEFDRASRIVNKIISDAALAKIDISEALRDPQRKAMYDEAVITRDAAKERLDIYKPTVKASFERMGLQFPEVTPPPVDTSATDTPAQRLAKAKARAGIK